jgi:hypothetical protein
MREAHGLRLTNQDKRRSMMTLLMDEEWGQWSDNAIARRCKVDQTTVSDFRRIMATTKGIPKLDEVRYTKNGKTQTMNVGKIGRKAAPPEPKQLPMGNNSTPPPKIPTFDPLDDAPRWVARDDRSYPTGGGCPPPPQSVRLAVRELVSRPEIFGKRFFR